MEKTNTKQHFSPAVIFLGGSILHVVMCLVISLPFAFICYSAEPLRISPLVTSYDAIYDIFVWETVHRFVGVAAVTAGLQVRVWTFTPK